MEWQPIEDSLLVELDWLEGDYTSLSYVTQSEFSCSAAEDAEYGRDRDRAERVFALLRAALDTRR